MSSFALSNVYNNFITTFSPKTTRYDNHKRDELKKTYHSIVAMSKEEPLYMIERGTDSQIYALGLKENARQLRNTITSLTSEHSSSVLDRKVASSSDPDKLGVTYVGSDEDVDGAPDFDIEISSLATPQVNIGSFLNKDTMKLEADLYSFDVNINDTDYEFQFSIDNGDTNKEIQQKISRLINRSNIGINASVLEEGDTSAIRLESSASGHRSDNSLNFRISDENTSMTSGVVSYFGLNEIAHDPTNAHFKINGQFKSTTSNNFTVGKVYEVELKGLTEEDTPVHVGLKADVDALTENISNLAGAYNDFLRKAAEYTSNYGRSNRIMNEMQTLASHYASGLTSIGLNMQENGIIEINDELLTQSTSVEDPKTSLDAVQQFTDALVNKSSQVSLNPMHYAEQKMVAYKNPGKNLINPYMTSMYTGMMFSSYC